MGRSCCRTARREPPSFSLSVGHFASRPRELLNQLLQSVASSIWPLRFKLNRLPVELHRIPLSILFRPAVKAPPGPPLLISQSPSCLNGNNVKPHIKNVVGEAGAILAQWSTVSLRLCPLGARLGREGSAEADLAVESQEGS